MKKIFLTLILSTLYQIVFPIDTICIGVNVAPPFIIENNGKLNGVTIDIVENTLGKINLPYRFVLYENVPLLIDGLENHEVDIIASSLTINANRLENIDFSQPFFHTDIAIIVEKIKPTFLTTLKSIFSKNVIKILTALVLLLFFLGIIIWVAERKKNQHFRKDWKGIFDGAYFMSVVMTTVGFGDKAAITSIGKTIVVIWMFIALGITGLFIGGISSSLTINSIESGIENISDLNKLKVGCIANTTPGKFLEENNIKYINYKNVLEGLNDMKNGNLEAFVYDRPVLIFYNDFLKTSFEISKKKYYPQTFGIGFRYDNPLREYFNVLLLNYMESDNWNELMEKYKLK